MSVVVSWKYNYKKTHNGYDIVVLIKSLRICTGYLKDSSAWMYNDTVTINTPLNTPQTYPVGALEEDLLPWNDQNEGLKLMPRYLTSSDFFSFYTDWQKLRIPTTFSQDTYNCSLVRSFLLTNLLLPDVISDCSYIWQRAYSLKDILGILKLRMWLPIG